VVIDELMINKLTMCLSYSLEENGKMRTLMLVFGN